MILFFKYRRHLSVRLQSLLSYLVFVVGVQFSLGVLTLLMNVMLPLAVIHQVGASVVLLLLLWLRWDVQQQQFTKVI